MPIKMPKKERPTYQLHEIEGAVELRSSPPLIVQPSLMYELHNEQLDALKKYQIYFLMRRPRLTIVPNSIRFDMAAGLLTFNVAAQIKDKFEEFEVIGGFPGYYEVLPRGWVPESIWADDDFPSTNIYISPDCGGDLGVESIRLPLSDFLSINRVCIPKYTNFLVDYIGHSLGEDGCKGAIERLIGRSNRRDAHEHLQHIALETISKHPDHEIFIGLFSYEFQQKFAVGGYSPFEPVHSIDEEPDRIDRFMDARIERAHRIKMAEAALIRYFQPEFNNHYKDRFPANDHTILNPLRDLDITGIYISVDTEENAAILYTAAAEPSMQHTALYPIVSNEDRASFFDISFPNRT